VFEREGLVQRGAAALLRLREKRCDTVKGLLGVVAGALCALAIACAAGQKSASAPPPTAVAPSAEMGRGSPEHAQIEQLDREISEARQKMGLGAQAVPAPAPMAPSCTGPACPQEMASQDCHPGTSETCSNSCTFKQSICDNATKICELAKQLPGDAWATDKCNAGNASCNEATQRCCTCR
jgi:hypothetical protein